MYVKKPKKQCPHNAWVECDDEDCQCCGWNPAGRTRIRQRKKRVYTRRTVPNIKEKNMDGNRRRQINNTSGYTGVHWNKLRNKWQAVIQRNGKKINLGCFDDFEDAVRARQAAEEQMIQKKEA